MEASARLKVMRGDAAKFQETIQAERKKKLAVSLWKRVLSVLLKYCLISGKIGRFSRELGRCSGKTFGQEETGAQGKAKG